MLYKDQGSPNREATYPDLQMGFIRSILSSAQTSAGRLTQPAVSIPQLLRIPSQAHVHTPYSVKTLSVLIGLIGAPNHSMYTLVDFIFHRLAGTAQIEWVGGWVTHCLRQLHPIIAP